MPVTVRNADILFNDGTTQSTAAGAPTTAQILNATAGATAGAVGTYAFARRNVSQTISANTTYAGSQLVYAGFHIFDTGYQVITTPGTGGALTGTWRAFGGTSGSGNIGHVTLFLRIS